MDNSTMTSNTPITLPFPSRFFSPRRRYPSDLNDSQWKRVLTVLSAGTEISRQRQVDLREVLNGINYRWTTGCVWRMLPHDLPPWGTIYAYYRKWQQAGLLPSIRRELTCRKSRPRNSHAPTTNSEKRIPPCRRESPAFPTSTDPRVDPDRSETGNLASVGMRQETLK